MGNEGLRLDLVCFFVRIKEMKLYLEFIEGPVSGRKISVTHKTSLGRVSADILIDDPKLSGIHAFFELDESMTWWVKDNGSRNGVLVNGHKEIRTIVRDEDIIQMGSNRIQCRILRSDSLRFSEKFQFWAQSLIGKIKNSKNICQEIRPEIQLKVIQGLQYKQVWSVFYGPRYAGRNSFDICLYDEKAPTEAFQILAKGKYPYFATKNEEVVKMNDKNLKHKQLEHGDIISFGESQILVEFDEGHGFRS